MKIVIGSMRQPKIEAVKNAVTKIQQAYGLQDEAVEFLPRESESNISAMPLSLQELMRGAYNRVRNLKVQFQNSENRADFYVGLEGGFFRQESPEAEPLYFLQSWVYVSDNEKGYFGASGAIPVPRRIVVDVVEGKKELGDVIDRYAAEENIRDKGGAFSVFSSGLLTRQAAFEVAVLSAFAPFFNQRLYSA